MNSIMVDTSFCIRLLKEEDELHQNTVDYFEYFLENKIIIYISSIVIAEYSVKDDPYNLPLSRMRIIPFDLDDAKKAGEFHNIILKSPVDRANNNRLVIKDDCKILSQISNRGIEGYITKDRRSFNEIIKPVVIATDLRLELLDLANPLSHYKNELPFPRD
jgi:predicted nucleic acid-binding protein